MKLGAAFEMTFSETETQRSRNDFPSLQRKVDGHLLAFFDGPGGTQVPNAVIEAVSHYYKRSNANTHGPFITSVETLRLLEDSRAAVADFLGASSAATVSFGANMTSLTFSLSHALARKMRPGDEVVITELDHEANRGPWLNLRELGITVKEVPLRADGTLDMAVLEELITERTRIVALGIASNALGTVTDLSLPRALSKRVGAYLVVDAVHYAPHFPLDVLSMDVDFLLCSAYKFYGPHVGILYSRPGLLDELDTDRLRTQDQVGPYRIETGTLNHAAIAGVKAAIEYIATWGTGSTLRERIVSAMRDIAAYEHGLAAFYHRSVGEIPGVTVYGPEFSDVPRAPTVSITLEGTSAPALSAALAEQGLAVWAGHFYAIRTVEKLGLAEQGGLLRTGISMYNTPQEVERLLNGIRDCSLSR